MRPERSVYGTGRATTDTGNRASGPEFCPADRPDHREINFTRTRDSVLDEIKASETQRMIIFVSTGGSNFYRTFSQTRFQVYLAPELSTGGYPTDTHDTGHTGLHVLCIRHGMHGSSLANRRRFIGRVPES